MSETITIRPANLADEPFLWEMLYHAIYVPEGQPALPRAVVAYPEISRYVAGWGRTGDAAMISLDGSTPVGAAWLRLLGGDDRGYGYVDDATPELTVAVLPGYRGQGIGGRLLQALLQVAQARWPQVALSVDVDNPARRLYERLEFEIVGHNGGSLTMIKRL